MFQDEFRLSSLTMIMRLKSGLIGLLMIVLGGAVSAATPERNAAASAQLDVLFDQLALARSREDAVEIESAIWRHWNRSGSVSVDLLMKRALEAFDADSYDEAEDFLDHVVDLAPGFAEGWNKRATVYFLRRDFGRALDDLEQALILEPRHFGALGGMAVILEDMGDKRGALETYRQILNVNPWLDGAEEAERRLTLEVEGQGI